jgi:uncharacterized membrane protein YgdD (TMEM256/DUF423 family)|nr:DUF423 domain-containing protein [Rhodothermus marinus]MBO2490865.1 DUF423 domain-containing protein [Rhodothermus marinus]
MARTFLVLGAVLAGLAVALGAFAAHGLAPRVSPERLQTFETGVRYQMYHALALLLTGWLLHQLGASGLSVAGWCFLAGIVLFSGSLYVLVLTDTPWLGAVAPLGGTAFILGWGMLAWSLWRALRA